MYKFRYLGTLKSFFTNVACTKHYGCKGSQYPAEPKGPQAKNSMFTQVQ